MEVATSSHHLPPPLLRLRGRQHYRGRPRSRNLRNSALLLLLLLVAFPLASLAVNITAVLSGHPELSEFSRLLDSTTVAADLASRSSLTLLALPNSFLLHSSLTRSAAAADLADVLRYHILLEYLSWSDLLRVSPSGKLVTTLFQTTGRASADLGAVNLTASAGPDGAVVVTARSKAPFSPSNASVLGPVATLPYNVSVLAVDGLLLPYSFDLAASQSRPLALNITRVLVDARDFNVVASMLEASGVAEEFEAYERGVGVTVFVPTDEAFAALPATERLQSLPADRKAVVLRFHVLHSYYPLGSLESIVNPVQPTLATEDTIAGRFTLNITRANGSVAIDTGLVQASITRTVFDQNPVAVFAVSRVLLPREIFGAIGGEIGVGGKQLVAPPPVDDEGIVPEGGIVAPPARLSSHQGLSNAAPSVSGICTVGRTVMYLLLLPFLVPPLVLIQDGQYLHMLECLPSGHTLPLCSLSNSDVQLLHLLVCVLHE